MSTLTLRTPEDIISAVPHMIGFYPTDSLVVMVPGGSPSIARIDMPTTPKDQRDAIAALTPLYRENLPMIALTYTGEDEEADATVALLRQRGKVLTHIRVHAETYRADNHEERPLADSLRVEAEMVLRGSNPAPSREALVLPTKISDSLAATLSTGKFDGAQAGEEAWVLGRLASHTLFTDEELARILTGCRRFGPRFRDLLQTTFDRTTDQRDQWRDAAERVGNGWTEVLVTYAMASWMCGDGSHAWLGLTAVAESPEDRDKTLALLLGQAIAGGIDPRSFPVMTLNELNGTENGVES